MGTVVTVGLHETLEIGALRASGSFPGLIYNTRLGQTLFLCMYIYTYIYIYISRVLPMHRD